MAQVRHFFGDQQLSAIQPMANAEFFKLFGAARAKRSDSFSRYVGRDAAGVLRPVERAITIKSRPSLHACSDRCTAAKGHQCECECGGKNHGAAW